LLLAPCQYWLPLPLAPRQASRTHALKKDQRDGRTVAKKPRDAAVVLFGLEFANNIHYKFKSSQAKYCTFPEKSDPIPFHLPIL